MDEQMNMYNILKLKKMEPADKSSQNSSYL